MLILKWNIGNRNVWQKKNQTWVFTADRKILPSGSLFGITRHSLVMPNRDPLDGIFYPHLTSMHDSYIICEKKIWASQKVCFVQYYIVLFSKTVKQRKYYNIINDKYDSSLQSILIYHNFVNNPVHDNLSFHKYFCYVSHKSPVPILITKQRSLLESSSANRLRDSWDTDKNSQSWQVFVIDMCHNILLVS